MKYAVIDISGHQSVVSENDILTVDQIDSPEKSKLSLDKVILLAEDDSVIIGNPYIKDALIQYEIISHKKGKKLHVFQYKAKSRYRRKTGFRPKLTDIKITSIAIKKPTPTKTSKVKSEKTIVTKKTLKK